MMAAEVGPNAGEDAALLEHAAAFLYGVGGVVIPPTREPGAVVHVPFSLLPRSMPRAAYDDAVALAAPFNELVEAIARQPDWMLSVLEPTAAADPFTGRLVDIARAVLAEPGGIRQRLYLGVHRSDYMLHEEPAADAAATGSSKAGVSLRQIELNTVSSAFAGLSARISQLHAFMLDRFTGWRPAPGSGSHVGSDSLLLQPLAAAMKPFVDAAAIPAQPAAVPLASCPVLGQHDGRLPKNGCDESVADAIAAAHVAYGVSSAVVLFVVQPAERNILDQRVLEHALWRRHRVPVRRVTLEWLGLHGRLGRGVYVPRGDSAASEHCLLVPREAEFAAAGASAPGEDEVSVVYYRSGYSPGDFTSEACWAAKLTAERSVAVKCPPILYHLAGTKKVQQALALPGAVERFVPAPVAARLRRCFAGLWSLDPAERDAEAAAAILDAYRNPGRYVVKPQREGGGNNLFGGAVHAALAHAAAEITSKDSAAAALAPGAGAAAAPVAAGAADASSSAGAVDAATSAAPAADPGVPSDGSSAGYAGTAGGMTNEELAAHILMERVFPPSAPARLCRLGTVTRVSAVSELGIYGVFLGDGLVPPMLNAFAGHLLRTKADGTDEGGVAAGFAVLDSPFLTD